MHIIAKKKTTILIRVLYILPLILSEIRSPNAKFMPTAISINNIVDVLIINPSITQRTASCERAKIKYTNAIFTLIVSLSL